MNLSTKIYWINPEGDLIRVPSDYPTHAVYAAHVIYDKPDVDLFSNKNEYNYLDKAIEDGWIKINRTLNDEAVVALKIPSVSTRAVSRLRKFVADLWPSIQVRLVEYATSKDLNKDNFSQSHQHYLPKRFLEIYKSNRISKIVVLSRVQRFRESSKLVNDFLKVLEDG